MSKLNNTSLNQSIASYRIFSGLIYYPTEVIYINNKGFNLDILPIVMHEYLHYYINFQTGFHIYGRYIYYDLLSRLSKQKLSNSIPIISNIHNFANIPLISESFNSYIDWMTQIFYTDPNKYGTNLRKISSCELSVENKNIHNIQTVKVSDGYNNEELDLNGRILNECAAHIFERIVAKKLNKPLPTAYAVPYLVLDPFFQKHKIHEIILLTVLLLAFNNPLPSLRFSQIIYTFKKLIFDTAHFKAKTVKKRIKQLTRLISKDNQTKKFNEALNKTVRNLLDNIPNLVHWKWFFELSNCYWKNLKKNVIPYPIKILLSKKPFNEVFYKIFLDFPPYALFDIQSHHSSKYLIILPKDSTINEKDVVNFTFLFENIEYLFKHSLHNYSPTKCPSFDVCKHITKGNICQSSFLSKIQTQDPCSMELARITLNY